MYTCWLVSISVLTLFLSHTNLFEPSDCHHCTYDVTKTYHFLKKVEAINAKIHPQENWFENTLLLGAVVHRNCISLNITINLKFS